MSEILRELEEDLQNERLQKLWNNFGKVIIGLSLAIVLGTAGAVIGKNVRQTRASERTSELIRGMDRLRIEDYQGGVGVFDSVTAKGSAPHTAMAALNKARAQAALGNSDAAGKTYETVGKTDAEDGAAAFSDLARLMAIAETGATFPLSGESAFSHSKTEQAAWRKLKEGKKDEAAQTFSLLRDNKDAPRSMRSRAQAALDYLAPAKREARAGHGD